MTDTILARVGRVIRETFSDDSIDISRDTIAQDVPGWDSLSHTILMLSLEDEFGIVIPPDHRGFTNLGQLVDTIAAISDA